MLNENNPSINLGYLQIFFRYVCKLISAQVQDVKEYIFSLL